MTVFSALYMILVLLAQIEYKKEMRNCDHER